MDISTKTVVVNESWTLITNEVCTVQFNDEMYMAVTDLSEPAEAVGLIVQAEEQYVNGKDGIYVWAKKISGGTNIESVRIMSNGHGTKYAPFIVKDIADVNIEEGDTYELSGVGSIDDGESFTFIGQTNSKLMMLKGFAINTSAGPVTIDIIENPTVNVQGTEVAPINKNRISDTTAHTETFAGSEISGGTVISSRKLHDIGGGAHTVGGETNFGGGWILKSNTAYAMRVSAEADIDFSIVIEWSEVDQ